MKTVIEFVKGKKTYTVVFVLLAYVVLCEIGVLQMDEAIIVTLGGAAMATLRAGIAKGEETTKVESAKAIATTKAEVDKAVAETNAK